MKKMISAAQQGDSDALEQIVMKNIGLVYAGIKRFYQCGQSHEDLYQIGCIGLIKAVKRFDLSLEVQFSTYAVTMILGEIRQFLRDNSMVKMSRNWKIIAYKATRFQEECHQKTGNKLTVSELASKLNVSSEELVMAMDAYQCPKSLDVLSEYDRLHAEYLSQNELIDRIDLREAIGKLDKTEQKIILLRYFRYQSQKDTSDILKCSQAHVSRQEKKILRKLKEFL
ncbi:MAG: sigma-70 family RNA polymerase sigma factor [Ruminococcaceae bacterium]|nr:sigma-70 family RNA polymerase sigma factor [Oscillospiraceae bacterium]